jgi:serine/threonine protein kinase
MAPEFLGGTITPKSDIFSLGILIIEILTGQKGCPEIENVRATVCSKIKAKCLNNPLVH